MNTIDHIDLFIFILRNRVLKNNIFNQIKLIHKEKEVIAFKYGECDLEFIASNGYIGLFVDRFKQESLSYSSVNKILLGRLLRFANYNQLQFIHQYFNQSFTSSVVDECFIRADPHIIKWIFSNRIPYSAQALYNCAMHNHLSYLETITIDRGTKGYAKKVYGRAIMLAARNNNFDIFKVLWEMVNRDRYYSAKCVDYFSSCGNLEAIKLILEDMKAKDDVLYYEHMLHREHKDGFKPFRAERKSFDALKLAKTKEIAKYLYQNGERLMHKITDLEFPTINFEVFAYLVEINLIPFSWYTLYYPISRGKLDCFVQFYKNNLNLSINYTTPSTRRIITDIIAKCLLYGFLNEASNLCQRLKNNGHNFTVSPRKDEFLAMCHKGHYDCLQFLFGINRSISREFIENAIQISNNERIVKLLQSQLN